MLDVDKSRIENVEEYMNPSHNNAYYKKVENAKNKIYGEGIDIGYYTGDGISRGNGAQNGGVGSSGVSPGKFDSVLNQPTGFNVDQFRAIFVQFPSDEERGVFRNNAETFYEIEQEYGINALFVASIGILESDWGRSNMAKEKHNLFGIAAYDNDTGAAYKFGSDAECIKYEARMLSNNYLNPNGKYYVDGTLRGINQYYASAPNWADGVESVMQSLYNAAENIS